MYSTCEIYGTNDWSMIIYEGPVRTGSFGTETDYGKVLRCDSCGVDRLDEEVSISSAAYESDSIAPPWGRDWK